MLQETGYSKILPTGIGLVPFTTIDEAADAIRDVSSNYASHSKAARALAYEYMEAGKVTRKFLDKIGI